MCAGRSPEQVTDLMSCHLRDSVSYSGVLRMVLLSTCRQEQSNRLQQASFPRPLFHWHRVTRLYSSRPFSNIGNRSPKVNSDVASNHGVVEIKINRSKHCRLKRPQSRKLSLATCVYLMESQCSFFLLFNSRIHCHSGKAFVQAG